MAQILEADNRFSPCPVESGDEIFPNGIFEFNITKIIDHIQRTPDNYLEEVLVKDFYTGFSSVNESYMEHVEVSRPIILAEISPGRYNVIDERTTCTGCDKKSLSIMLGLTQPSDVSYPVFHR